LEPRHSNRPVRRPRHLAHPLTSDDSARGCPFPRPPFVLEATIPRRRKR
jgi:hypothetical protein